VSVGCGFAGNVTYSNQYLAVDGLSETSPYVNQTFNSSTGYICDGGYPWDPNCKFFGGSVNIYQSLGIPNPPPFQQTTDLVYAVDITINGSTQRFTHTTLRASRNPPVWAASSGAYYEGPYYSNITFNGADCRMMTNVGHWASYGGTYSKHVASNITCDCAANGTPLTPPAQCGYSNGGTFNSAAEVNAGLCAAGSSSPPVSGGSPWNWTCYSSNGGATASCSAGQCVPDGFTENFDSCSGTDGVYVDNCGGVVRYEWNDPMCSWGGGYIPF
jgi:hypothetical protein